MKVLRAGLVLIVALYGTYLGWLYFNQRSIIYPGTLTKVPPTAPVASDIEVVRLPIVSGEVEALFLPALGVHETTERSATLIFAHGNAEVTDQWVERLTGFRERGLNVLLVEYPGYGRSTGTPSESSIKAGFLAAYDHFVNDPRVDPTKMIGYGHSLGGGAICLLARERPLAAIILQSTFSSLGALANRYFAPSFLLHDQYDNLLALTTFSGPVLIIHGLSDEGIPSQAAQELAAVAKRHTVKLYECGHWCWYPDRLPFWRDVDDFLSDAGLTSGQIASAQDRTEGILSSFGYIIKQSGSTQPSAWEKAQYQTLAKKVIKVKSAKAVPGWSDAFYRFTVTEERYADTESAEVRLSRLREMPPDLNSPGEAKAFPLRTGFQYGKEVYIVSTDVSMFTGEMKRIAKELEASFRRERE